MPAAAARKKRRQFGVKDGSRISQAKAQLYGEFLQDLSRQNDGRLEAETVVVAARSPKSPLHGYFEWSDSIAAAEYRKVQARELIRAIVIVEEKTGIEVRAFENVFVPQDDCRDVAKSYYVPIQKILGDRGLTEQIIEDAINNLRWFRKKFESLSQLRDVHQVIDRTLAKLGGVCAPAKK